MADQTSVDYDQASVNSSEMATASDHADPAATTIDNVTVNQTTTTWSDHAEATTCKDAYTRALENLKACIEATKADIDKLKTNYDRAVAAFQQGDLDTAAEAEGLIRNWKMNRTPINAPAPPPAPADGSVPPSLSPTPNQYSGGFCPVPSSPPAATAPPSGGDPRTPTPTASPSGEEPGTPTPTTPPSGTPTPTASPSGTAPGAPTPTASPSGEEPGTPTPTASPSAPQSTSSR